MPTQEDPFSIDIANLTTQELANLVIQNIKRPKKQTTTEEGKPLTMNYFVSYPSLKVNKVTCNKYEKTHPLQLKPFKFCTNDALVGIEVEVENMQNILAPIQCYWSAKNDGSLRNNGVEFVSQPLAPTQIQYALEHLYEVLHSNNNPDFSNRTSIHVHLNCRDLTEDQTWNLVILYCLFEKHFYKFAGTRRLNSIFCVPVYRSNILKYLNQNIYHHAAEWSKYCGLNILPLNQNNITGCYGTIEFRHLYGTDNPQVIMTWINNILALRKMAMEMPKQELILLIEEMNTTSSYKWLYNQLFSPADQLLTSNKDFEDCISHTKRELFGDEYKKTINFNSSSAYWTMANSLNISG